MMSFTTPKQRSRIYIIQALYQWQLCGDDTMIIEAQFINQKTKISKQFFINTFRGIVKEIEALKIMIKPHLDHDIAEIPLVDLSILYLGVYELKSCQLPSKIIFNESIELAKQYGTEGSYRFINHLLDKINTQCLTNNSVFK